ncbi:MAG: molecular chaperone Hsp33 [Alphaproteobacteria bacterium]|nr:molecular chaperone Hsp33 [Alphaproteobacteria bacterium]
MKEKSETFTDTIQGFHLVKTGIKGRIVRLGPELAKIIGRHAYPGDVAALLAETLAFAAVLAYALKYEGTFTLQTKGDGPVGMIVADMGKHGAMRGYAQYDAEKVKYAGVKSALLIGKGHLAFTVDPGNGAQRYQGIVDLIGRDMAACVQNYFRQSEQLDTAFRIHLGQNEAGEWRASAIMLQRIPDGGGYAANNNEAGGDIASEERTEDWRRSQILLATTTDAEMLDEALPLPQLLNRLFHEEGLELGDVFSLQDQCRCSRQRVAMVLSTLPQTELHDMIVDGKIEVTCEFCSSSYEFDEEQLKKLAAGPGIRDSKE